MVLLFGPVASGGTGTLPGIVLCVLGLVGLLALPRQVSRSRSGGSGLGRIAFLVATDLAFVTLGLLLFSGRI